MSMLQDNPQPKPATTAAEDVRILAAKVDMGFDSFLRLISNIRSEGYDLPLMEFYAIESREAFARYRDHVAALTAFVADVRDSKARATSDEEYVMAMVRLGDAAGRLLEEIAK